MEVANNILRDISDEENPYFVDLDTGVKVDVFYSSDDMEIVLKYGNMLSEDIEKISSLGINFQLLKNNSIENDDIIDSLKKVSDQIKEGILSELYPESRFIKIKFGEYMRVVSCNPNNKPIGIL